MLIYVLINAWLNFSFQISKNVIFENFWQYLEIWCFHNMICVSQSKTIQALSIAV